MSVSQSPVSRLTATLDRARAAIQSAQHSPSPAPESSSSAPKGQQVRQGSESAALNRPSAPLTRPQGQGGHRSPQPAPQAPSRPFRVPSGPRPCPAARILPTFPTAQQVQDGAPLTRGAARLWGTLHRLALDVARHRAHEARPDALTFHLPAVGLAVFLGYTERHLARLAAELEGLGLIAYGAHAQNVYGRALWDGTLWKVSLTPGHAPRIRADEWKHVWRADFAADYHGKTGVRAEMSGLLTTQDAEGAYQHLKTRAAVQISTFPPAVSSPDISRAAVLDSVAADLQGLARVHHSRRHDAVTRAAAALGVALNEPQRRAQWAGMIWKALRAQWEGRNELQGLALALLRLRADLLEGAPWRNPGAVLTARLS